MVMVYSFGFDGEYSESAVPAATRPMAMVAPVSKKTEESKATTPKAVEPKPAPKSAGQAVFNAAEISAMLKWSAASYAPSFDDATLMAARAAIQVVRDDRTACEKLAVQIEEQAEIVWKQRGAILTLAFKTFKTEIEAMTPAEKQASALAITAWQMDSKRAADLFTEHERMLSAAKYVREQAGQPAVIEMAHQAAQDAVELAHKVEKDTAEHARRSTASKKAAITQAMTRAGDTEVRATVFMLLDELKTNDAGTMLAVRAWLRKNS
jgi:hypothetical protein